MHHRPQPCSSSRCSTGFPESSSLENSIDICVHMGMHMCIYGALRGEAMCSLSGNRGSHFLNVDSQTGFVQTSTFQAWTSLNFVKFMWGGHGVFKTQRRSNYRLANTADGTELGYDPTVSGPRAPNLNGQHSFGSLTPCQNHVCNQPACLSSSCIFSAISLPRRFIERPLTFRGWIQYLIISSSFLVLSKTVLEREDTLIYYFSPK